jgi:hypothetical protein
MKKLSEKFAILKIGIFSNTFNWLEDYHGTPVGKLYVFSFH